MLDHCTQNSLLEWVAEASNELSLTSGSLSLGQDPLMGPGRGASRSQKGPKRVPNNINAFLYALTVQIEY